jgi:hypothetical protein
MHMKRSPYATTQQQRTSPGPKHFFSLQLRNAIHWIVIMNAEFSTLRRVARRLCSLAKSQVKQRSEILDQPNLTSHCAQKPANVGCAVRFQVKPQTEKRVRYSQLEYHDSYEVSCHKTSQNALCHLLHYFISCSHWFIPRKRRRPCVSLVHSDRCGDEIR